MEGKIQALLPGYMAMGEGGMAEMQEMAGAMGGPATRFP